MNVRSIDTVLMLNLQEALGGKSEVSPGLDLVSHGAEFLRVPDERVAFLRLVEEVEYNSNSSGQ